MATAECKPSHPSLLGSPGPATALGLRILVVTQLALLGQGKVPNSGPTMEKDSTSNRVFQLQRDPQAHLMLEEAPADFHWALSIEWPARCLAPSCLAHRMVFLRVPGSLLH